MAFEELRRSRFALLTTFRKDGRPVPTPVWVALAGDRAYVVSRGPGKVKRARANPNVELVPCSSRGRPRGPQTAGRARIVDGGLPKAAKRAFARKYGPLPAIGRAVAQLFGKQLVVIEVAAA